jgi:hypothetical protein
MGGYVAGVFGCGYDSDSVCVSEVWGAVEREESVGNVRGKVK